MPNHIATQITVRGRRDLVDQLVAQVKSTYKDEKGNEHESPFDFNKITPMPESLDIDEGSRGHDGMKYILALAKESFDLTDDDRKVMERMSNLEKGSKEEFDETIELGRKYLRNIAEYGHPTWYGWSRMNWGTKWNCYDVEGDGLGNYSFNTAWCFAYPVIERLSQMFPELEIEFAYADEDCGCNTGCGTFRNGELIGGEIPENCSDRAYEIYNQCHCTENQLYKDDDGVWRWHDEDGEPEED